MIHPIHNHQCRRAVDLLRSICWWSCFGVLIAVCSSEGLAAGCHRGDELPPFFDVSAAGLSSGVVDPLHPAKLLAVAKTRVYRDGRLMSFPKLDSGLQPCDGPGCRGKESDHAPSLIFVPRVHKDVPTNGIQPGSVEPPAPLVRRLQVAADPACSDVFSGGLFRPPRQLFT